ncbi:MAG: aminoglycoside phosphotransferase family protein [Nocardioidaceae bacterium]
MEIAATHEITFGKGTVTKRFGRWERGEHRREWRALTLLDEHRPGLAPGPLTSGLDEDPPYVVMSRVTGTHIAADAPATAHQLDGLAAALTALHEALPADELGKLPERLWAPRVAVAAVRQWADDKPQTGDDPLVWEAMTQGRRWIASADAEALGSQDARAVFAHADGNLANYVWDGRDAHPVDFEDSGRSDLAFELADVAEHLSMWVDDAVDAESLLDRFDLSADERERLKAFRRVFALFWLLMLLPEGPAHRRNPAGTLQRQAERLLNRL